MSRRRAPKRMTSKQVLVQTGVFIVSCVVLSIIGRILMAGLT